MSNPDGVMIRAQELQAGDVLLLPFGYEAAVREVRNKKGRVHFTTGYGRSTVESYDEVRIKERPGQALVKRIDEKVFGDSMAAFDEAAVRAILREVAAWLREDMADVEYTALEGAIERLEQEATP